MRNVTSAIVGARSVAQLNELLQARRVTLTSRDLDQLDDATAAEEVRIVPENTLRRRDATELTLN